MTAFVLPGVEEVRARRLRPVSMFMRDDLPTFERPMKAISGRRREGLLATRVLLPAYMACEIFISFVSSYKYR